MTLGDYVVLGGQVGIADHVTIGEGAQIAAKAASCTDVPAGRRWMRLAGEAGSSDGSGEMTLALKRRSSRRDRDESYAGQETAQMNEGRHDA